MSLNSRFRRQPDAETLHFPLSGYGRLALVDTGFRAEAGMQACDCHDPGELTRFAPESMVLPLGAAVSLAWQRLRGSLELPSLKIAIVVLTSLESGGMELLTEHHRDLLWRAFGVPVFEQLRGWDGRVIARECEVHDGLHFDAISVDARGGRLMVAGRAADCAVDVIREPCDCGLATPRVAGLARPAVRAAAA